MKGKTAVAHLLRLEGVGFITCFPANPLIEECALLEIRPIVARMERVAVNIAEGYARVSSGEGVGVCAVQYGPGAENAFPGLAQAYADSAPVLLLPTGYPLRMQGVPPNFHAPEGYRAVSKWAQTVTVPDRLPQNLRYAFTLLRNGKPGPVALELPTDVLEGEVAEPLPSTPVKTHRPAADPGDVAETVEALLRAERPIIVAGQGVLYARAWDLLVELAELVQAPVMTTLNGKSAFPEDHPLSLGTGGRSRPATVDHFLRRADFVLGVGTSFTVSGYTTPIPPGKTMAQVTISEEDVNKDYPISYGAIGDARAVLAQMVEEVRRRLGPQGRRGEEATAREVRAVREEFMRQWLPRLTSDDTPISPYRVIWELMRALDRRRSVVTHDAGNPRDQMVPFYQALVPHGYIGWGKSTQLGTGLGLAMGAKLARPDRLCVNLMGDAAFGMVGMDFETAVRCGIPVLTVVLNNGLMGGYDRYLPVSTARYRARFLSGDYHQVAQGLGGYTERVERVEQLAPALRRAIAEVEGGRPALLEVLTREEPVFPMG